MGLESGSRLGPYEIVAPLGQGGMGEVYRARDTRLDRTVAIKVLPGKGVSDEQRLRFEREARAVAALQHPHICVLYDVGDAGGVPYLVMEHLEGETLAQRLRRGPLPLAELVRCGGEIADALARAHAAGIVHRDLKPANIMLTRAGAKLLDFGLAKPRTAAHPAAAPTPSFTASLVATALESPLTQAGTVMGTAPYMSPEQVQGLEAGPLSDIFSLGCLLYEMACARRAFDGASSLSVAAAILEKEPPPLRELQPLTPPALEHVVARCLRKAPEERWQSSLDIKHALQWAGATAAAALPAPPPARQWLWPAVALAAVAAALAMSWRALRAIPAAPTVVSEITPPSGMHFNLGGIYPGMMAVSPDGRQIAFAARDASGQTSLWLRPLAQVSARQLPGTADASLPFWSPDGGALGYFTNAGLGGEGNLMVLSLAGGLPRALAATATPRGGTWGRDGAIVFAPSATGGLMQVASGGGTARPLPLPQGNFSSLRYPVFLPDGRHLLYFALSHGAASDDMIYYASLDGRQNFPLVHSVSAPAAAGNELLYSAGGTLMAQPLNQASGQLTGAARAIAGAVYEDDATWRPGYSASANGVLAYAAGTLGEQALAWADRSGKIVGALPPIAGYVTSAALAPDGHRLALSVDNGVQDVWIEDLASGSQSRLTFGPILNDFPAWSPDGNGIVYSSITPVQGLYKRAAGGGPALAVASGLPMDTHVYARAWSSDGREIVAEASTPSGWNSLVAIPANGGVHRIIVAAQDRDITEAKLSPDGRWLAFIAGPHGGARDIYVVPFRGASGVWQVTTTGALAMVWTHGGAELDCLLGDGSLRAIPVTSQANEPAFGAPHLLAVRFPPLLTATPDGQRFLVSLYPHENQHVMLVTNWKR